jgi:hypothetical protein
MKKVSNDEYYNLFCKGQGSGMGKGGFAARQFQDRVLFLVRKI